MDDTIFEIGKTFSKEDLKKEVPSFYKIYKNRPIKNNLGGMRASHMFACYFMLKKIKPKVVIESGVLRVR